MKRPCLLNGRLPALCGSIPNCESEATAKSHSARRSRNIASAFMTVKEIYTTPESRFAIG